jgi:energy-converting hydrogenase Eha subunit C
MTVGVSIFLGALGAILRFAVADEVDGVDLGTIGVILMVAAAVGLVIGLVQMAAMRRRVVTDVHEAPPRSY